MEDLDYKNLGFKAGLEIHQQLDTGKLFSRTPSLLRKDAPDYHVLRRLHKVAGEGGEVDEAVEHEANLNKEFIYQGYDEGISLVELDESPPRDIDEEALDEAIKIALLLNCEIYYYSQIMRKTVIDGSNTSGFQRTVLIGHDGYLDFDFGRIGITGVVLEEDAARIVEKNETGAVFRLDRLGIPLVEISTDANLRNPEQVKECALKLGEILRACKVKRGIGTIRQDVNVSIKGHDRVEIKGFQDPKMMIKTIDMEILRQKEDIKVKRTNGEVRKAIGNGSTEYLRPMPGRARMYPETDLQLLKIGKERINRVKKELPKLKGRVKMELKKKGVQDNLIEGVLNEFEEFLSLLKIYNKDANLIGKMVSIWRQDFASKSGKNLEEIKEILSEDVLGKVLMKLKEASIEESEVKGILKNIVKGMTLDEALKVEKVGINEIEIEVRKLVKEKPGLRENAYMGLIISKFGIGIDAKKTMEIIKNILK